MIFKIIVGGFFSLIELILGNVSIDPLNGFDGGGFVEFVDLISTASFFFPFDLLVFLFSLFLFTTTFLLVWSMIEWVYKKIPGVD